MSKIIIRQRFQDNPTKNNLVEFKKRVKQRKIRLAVVGLGYVGLPLACAFAKKGFPVFGIEVDKDRLRKLKRKQSYITDITSRGLKDIIQRKNLKFSGDFGILKDIDIVFVCVPTPLKNKYQPNISYIISAINSVAKNVKPGSLVVLESTTYPGTTHEIVLPIFEGQGLKSPSDIYLCFSPERVDPGNKYNSVEKIPKIIGGVNNESTQRGYFIYKAIIDKIFCVSSARVAETIKLLENTFRLVNIALIDEMAMMAHRMDIDIWEVIKGASTKPFGFMPFYPSAGVGGHCIPKDPLYLYWKARHFGFHSKFIKLASKITTFMPSYIAYRLRELLRRQNIPMNKSRVLVIGATYKKNVMDLRKSPSLDLIELLQRKGVSVEYFDPLIPYLKFNNIDLQSLKLSARVLKDFDCVIIATAHSDIDYDFILKNSSMVFDTCNVYDGITQGKLFRL